MEISWLADQFIGRLRNRALICKRHWRNIKTHDSAQLYAPRPKGCTAYYGVLLLDTLGFSPVNRRS